MASELNFNKLFNLSLLCMKINRSHPDVKRDMKWALQFLLMHGVFTIFFCLLVYSTVMHDLKNKDFTQACANGTIAVLYVVVSFQYFMIVWYQDKLRGMFATMKRDFADCTPEERTLVLKYAFRGRRVLKLWFVVVCISGALFPLKSIFHMIYYATKHEMRLVPVYELTYPKPLEEIKNDIIPFTIVYFAMLWYVFYASSTWTYVCVVPMGPIFMLHACSQLEIVKRKIDNFYPINGYRHVDTMNKMKDVATHLQDIHRFVEKIQNTFQYIYEMYMKGSAVTIPITAYQAIQSFYDGNISLEFVTITFACVFITSIPCYYSDLLLETGKSVGEAVYMSGWEKQWERRERNLTLMLLLRMTRPMAVRSIFRNVCLDALSDVFQQAYAIFNVLNASWS